MHRHISVGEYFRQEETLDMKLNTHSTSLSILLCITIITASCNMRADTSPLKDTATPIHPTSISQPTSPPKPTSTPYPPAILVITGEAEVVFDWSNDRCEDFDIPDLPARAFRDQDGNVQLLSTHLDNRRFIGPNLNEVKRDCQVVMKTAHDGDPSKFNDNTWLASLYTEDGQTIYSVIHQEFHGWEHGEACPGDNFTCWYNSLTMGISTDGGSTYQSLIEPPANLIATLPVPYEAGAGPYGVLEPSNIIKKDGYYYLFVRIDEYKSDAQRICLMRTDDLNVPSSWRAWDGSGFNIENIDPYAEPEKAKSAPKCAGMDGDLGMLNASITFNTYLNRYVMVGISTDNFSSSREIWGVMYALSDDLIEWDRRTLLFEMELPWTYQPGDGNVYLYPSLIDPDSPSRNFETADDTAYIYLTRFHEDFHLHRDLIRIPVHFFHSEEEANKAEVPFTP